MAMGRVCEVDIIANPLPIGIADPRQIDTKSSISSHVYTHVYSHLEVCGAQQLGRCEDDATRLFDIDIDALHIPVNIPGIDQ